MDSERWKRIDSLLHAAWERPAGEREAFLREACAGDETLEREVLSLMASEQQAGSFLDDPVKAAEFPESSDSTVTQLAGQTVSHYRILEMLGAGGMGVVYKAFDTKLNRLVALKFLPPHLRHDEELKGRLKAEARAASTLDHPNIVVIHDIDEAPSGDLFIAMAFHEGVTLRERIAAAGNTGMPVAEALEIARQIAAGLARAHERGILHRDIKPGNVIVASDGVTRIIDFGLAKSSDAAATGDGSTKGTPLYMSPEQASGKPMDCRTDLWSLGAVLYEMLAGRPPFDGEGNLAVMNAIVHAEPAGLRTLRPDVPPEVEAIVAKALEKDPARRYQSAGEMARDLATALAPGTTRPLTWRRAVLIPAAAACWRWSPAGYFYFHRTPKLTDKDTIVLADFLNKTGDPVFDGTLRQGLAVQLEQSPFLSLLSDERIQKALPLMGKAVDAPLTPAVARDICERTGGAAVLDGSISRIGSQYVVGLRARNCRTGDTLDEEQAQAARAEDVLNALSQIASKFRVRVGESLATVRTHDRPLAEVTTTSLEALQAYTTSLRVGYTSGQIASVPLLQRALEIDPNFALAYSNLAFSYGAMGEFAQAAESMKKAYALRDRASEKERYFITANYDTQVTGNLEKAQQTCELWAQTYPRDKEPHGLLSSLIYQQLGKFERSIQEGRTAVEIDPDFTPGYNNQVWSNLYLDRVEEAGNVLQQATARKLEMEDFFVLRYYIAFLKRDRAGMEQAAAVAQGKPAVEDWVLDEQAMASAYAGHRRQARSLSRRAIDMAKQGSHQEKAAIFEAGGAVTDAFFGYAPEARQGAKAALALSDGRDVAYGAAFALALAGDASRAQAIADDLEKRFGEDTFVKFTYAPALRALAALKNGEPQKAVDLLQASLGYEVAVPGSWFGFFGFLYPAYVRGEALLALHQYAEAAAEFRKITGHRGLVFCDPVGAVAWWRLGHALALSGDTANAKAAYQEFFTLWKEADADIPVLQQARTEFGRL